MNAIGGRELYSNDEFRQREADLKFIRSRPIDYPQCDVFFAFWLSIVDVIMFNLIDKAYSNANHKFDLV